MTTPSLSNNGEGEGTFPEIFCLSRIPKDMPSSKLRDLLQHRLESDLADLQLVSFSIDANDGDEHMNDSYSALFRLHTSEDEMTFARLISPDRTITLDSDIIISVVPSSLSKLANVMSQMKMNSVLAALLDGSYPRWFTGNHEVAQQNDVDCCRVKKNGEIGRNTKTTKESCSYDLSIAEGRNATFSTIPDADSSNNDSPTSISGSDSGVVAEPDALNSIDEKSEGLVSNEEKESEAGYSVEEEIPNRESQEAQRQDHHSQVLSYHTSRVTERFLEIMRGRIPAAVIADNQRRPFRELPVDKDYGFLRPILLNNVDYYCTGLQVKKGLEAIVRGTVLFCHTLNKEVQISQGPGLPNTKLVLPEGQAIVLFDNLDSQRACINMNGFYHMNAPFPMTATYLTGPMVDATMIQFEKEVCCFTGIVRIEDQLALLRAAKQSMNMQLSMLRQNVSDFEFKTGNGGGYYIEPHLTKFNLWDEVAIFYHEKHASLHRIYNNVHH